MGFLKLGSGLDLIFKFLDGLKELDDDTERLLVDIVISIALANRSVVIPMLHLRMANGGMDFKVCVKAIAAIRPPESVVPLAALMKTANTHELRDVASALEAIGTKEASGGACGLIDEFRRSCARHIRAAPWPPLPVKRR